MNTEPIDLVFVCDCGAEKAVLAHDLPLEGTPDCDEDGLQMSYVGWNYNHSVFIC